MIYFPFNQSDCLSNGHKLYSDLVFIPFDGSMKLEVVLNENQYWWKWDRPLNSLIMYGRNLIRSFRWKMRIFLLWKARISILLFTCHLSFFLLSSATFFCRWEIIIKKQSNPFRSFPSNDILFIGKQKNFILICTCTYPSSFSSFDDFNHFFFWQARTTNMI